MALHNVNIPQLGILGKALFPAMKPKYVIAKWLVPLKFFWREEKAVVIKVF